MKDQQHHYAQSEDQDQTEHPPGLTRVFALHLLSNFTYL